MNDHSTRTPQAFVVREGLIIPGTLLPNYDANRGATVTENSEYFEAYETCTCPNQTAFRDFAELNHEIERQLEAANFKISVAPNVQAKYDRLVYRIRNTWTVKYGLTFGGWAVLDGTAPPGVIQLAPPALFQVTPGLPHPMSSTLTPGTNVAPHGTMRGARGETVNAFPAGNQHPNTVPGVPATYVAPGLPPRSDFTFRAPQPTKPVSSRRRVRFAGGNVTPQPLFADGKDPHLSPYMKKVYTSLDKIYTASKREKAEQILKNLPHESVARCMEALWRYNDDVGRAETWLRQTPSTQVKHVIEIFDSGDEGQQQNGEHGRRHAKKKQKMSVAPPAGISKQTKKERKRKNRDMGTLQKPSTKAMSYLLTSPKRISFNLDNTRPQSLLGPDGSLGNSKKANEAFDFIPLDGTLIAPSSARKHTQGEVIDLTSDDDEPMALDKSHRRSNAAVVGTTATIGPLNSRPSFFASARTVTPDSDIWENIFQERSNAGISLKKPMKVNKIIAAIESHEQSQQPQSIATAAQTEQTTNAEQSLNNRPTDGKGNAEATDAASELEEGEIREDEPTAAMSKHASAEEQAKENNGEQSSIKSTNSNGALLESASRRDSSFVFSGSAFGALSKRSSFGAVGNNFPFGILNNSSFFGALGKPVFGSAWQPEPEDRS